jgi:hypothetical protein
MSDLVTLLGVEQSKAMRACWAGADVAIKIEVESRIELEAFAVNVENVDLVIAFGVDDPARRKVLDKEVVPNHQPFLVTRETQIMRTRARAEIHDT